MKYLVQFQAFQNRSPQRFVALNKQIESNGESEQGIDRLLRSPFSFSLSNIKTLEGALAEQNNSLTSGQQQQFSKLVNYHLARFQNEGEGTVRSRVLLAIFRSPLLNQFFTSSQRQNIEALLNKERKELEKLGSKKPDDWKPDDAIRVARSYRFIRNRLNTANLRINPDLKNTGDNLKLYAARLVEKPKRSSLDDLFVIELSRIFPKEGDWNNKRFFGQIMALAKSIKGNFTAQLEAGNDIPIDARNYWDTLVPESNEDHNTKLKDWLKRSAEVESLKAIMAKDHNGEEVAATQVPLLLSFEEYSFLTDLETEATTTKIGTNGETNRLLTAQKETAETAKKKVEAIKADNENQSERLKQSSAEALKEHPNLSSDLKAEFKNEWLNLPPAETADEAALSKIRVFEAWRERAIKAIVDAQSEEKNAALKAAQDTVTAEEEKVKELQTRFDKQQSEIGIYDNPAEQAALALKNHKKYFTARLQAGRLLAVDLDLLAQVKKESGSISQLLEARVEEKAEAISDLITETRGLVEQTLANELQINDLSNLDETELAKVDKFLSYEGVLASITKARTEKTSSALLKNFEALDKGEILDARQVITAVTLGIRRDIMASLEPRMNQNSKAYNQFLEHYSRQHQAINQTDRVEKMLGFAADIEKEKQEKVKDVHEHAYEKISSLFARSEEKVIIRDLNKILKTGLSGSTVLNHVQQVLPDEGFIHNATKSEIATYQRAIVDELTGKVTAENQDVMHLNQIAEKLLARLDEMKAAEVAKEALNQGAEQIEKTDDENLAVSARLELARRTRLIYVEAADMTEKILEDLDVIKDALEKKQNADDLISSFLQKYTQSYKPRFDTLKDALINECDLLFEGRVGFTDRLAEELIKSLSGLDIGFDQMRRSYNDPKVDISHLDPGFKKITAALNNDVLPLFNLNDGPVAKTEEHKINSTLENAARTHKYVRDELEVLQPEGAEKGREHYKKQLESYKTTVTNFSLAWDEAKKRLEKDLKKYNEDEFAFKHQMPKKSARELLRINDQRTADAQWAIGFFSGKERSHYQGSEEGLFDRWLQDYQNPETQPRALVFMNYFKDFKDTLGPEYEKFAEETEEMQAFRRDFDNNKPTLWLKKRYSFEIKWYTLKSIFMMAKQAGEFWNKRTERKNDRMAAELGGRLFGDTRMGREFVRDSNEKEDQRVSDFKNVHKSSNYQQLFKIIESAKNAEDDKDEVQAAVELIMEKGELRWDSPEFLGMLGRLQEVVMFNPEKDIKAYIENPALLKQKIGMAVTAIWDRPTWLQWKEDLPSKYKSRVDSHNNDYREEVQKGSVDTYLGKALTQWVTGEIDTNFERSKFESYLRNAFDNGEMNGYPKGDRRWYYLIMGLTLKNPQGDTILSPDTLSRFGELQNKMPFMDAFDDGASAKKNGRVVPEGTPGSHKNWTYEDFQAWAKYFDGVDPLHANKPETIKKVRRWLNESLLTTNDAQDRMGKIQLTGLDRDDAGILPLLVSAERLQDGILRYSSGDKRPADDKYYVNLLVSFNNNFEDSVEYMQRILNSEDKEAEGYEGRKNTQLRRFGGMMRSYFMISQALAGNWDTEGSVGAVNLSDAEWQNNNAAKYYNKINKAVQAFTGDESLKIVDGKRYNEQKSTNAGKYDRGTPEHKALMIKVRDTFGATDDYWNNVDRIEAFLRGNEINNILRIKVD